jgi:uncharacterized membrane protein YdbT with pleckstrin-like domain
MTLDAGTPPGRPLGNSRCRYAALVDEQPPAAPPTETVEEQFFHGHPSWRSILDFYLRGLLIIVVAGVLAGLITRVAGHKVSIPIVAAVVAVGLVVVLGIGFLRRLRTTYTITSRRLTIEIGLMSRELHECRLERVQNVNATQSMFERLLRIGTVDFDTAASSEYDFKFRGVESPQQIVRTVDQALQHLQESQSYAGPPAHGV